MPLTDKEKAAIRTLVEYGKDDVTRKEVAEEIRTSAHSEIWQPISGTGFNAGKAEGSREVTELQTKLSSVETQLTEARNKVAEYESKAPDTDGVIRGLNEKIGILEGEKKTIRREMNDRMQAALIDRDVAAFEKEAVSQGMDPRYAKSEARLLRDRMTYVDGKLVVYQDETNKIPVSVPADGDLLKALATDSVKVAPPGAILSRTDTGSGIRGENGSKATGDQWDKIRTEEQERAKVAAATAGDIVSAYRPDVGPTGVPATR